MSKLTHTLAAGILAAGGLTLHAQSSDALLNKLVQKGILSSQEAAELKKETDSGFDKAYRSRTGLPDWVNSLKLYGDVRGRAEGFWTENDAPSAPNNDRWRMRYRLRIGATATFKDNLELGFRFISGEPQGNFGGDPISSNSTLQDNAAKKFIYVDTAYGKWTPIKNDSWNLSATLGKMDNPFTISTMVIDDDYTPEGANLGLSYNINPEHALKLNGGLFWLDEIGQGSDSANDPLMLAAQLRWDAKWTPQIDTSIGAAFLVITDEQSLTNAAVPNSQVGNTRLANGALLHDYVPFVFDAALTYTFDKMPGYNGKFPLRFAGSYMHNEGAPSENDAYEAGVTVGKSGKKGTWEFSHRWRRQERDSWYEEMVDSDFGAFYQTGFPNSGLGGGYRGGTGLQGHVFRASYSPYDAITFNITYYWVFLIDEPIIGGRHAESEMSRLQLDAVWKF